MRRFTKYRHFRTIAEIVGALVLLSGGATAAAAVLPSAASNTIHGCASARTGALSVLLKAKETCPKGTTALTWNITGPPGPSGTTGVLGSKTNEAKVNSSDQGVECTLGQVLLTAGTTFTGNEMPADGQLLSIAQNTALFSLFGTEYGGNGTTTFGVPNLKKAAPDGLTYTVCVAGVFP
jgi:hypothetical protein